MLESTQSVPGANEDDFHDAVKNVPTDMWDKSLDKIEVQDQEQEATKINYIAAVRALKTQPQAAFNGTCLVCRESHNFDNCSVLKNTEFLRNHCIATCRALRKHNAERQANFSGNAASLPINPIGKRYNRSDNVCLFTRALLRVRYRPIG